MTYMRMTINTGMAVYVPDPCAPRPSNAPSRLAGQMVNTGSSADSARSQAFGLTHQPGDQPAGALSTIANTLGALMGEHCMPWPP